MWNPLQLLTRSSKKPDVSGITIFFLQSRPQTFSDEELSLAMQRAWGRKYDETNFYGVSTFDGEGGLLKLNDMFFTMQHFERRVDASFFPQRELPFWADHSAYTKFQYACPGGLPAGRTRNQFGWLMGRFAAELLGKNTVALLFTEAGVLVPFTPTFDQTLRAEPGKNPEQLFAEVGQ